MNESRDGQVMVAKNVLFSTKLDTTSLKKIQAHPVYVRRFTDMYMFMFIYIIDIFV